MNELEIICKDLKKKIIPKKRNSKEPVKFWSEKELFMGKPAEAFVIILRTKGCTWANISGCSMCGYFNDSSQYDIESDDLLKQLEKAMERYKGEKIIKIFNSGSFFDNNEIKPKTRINIIKLLSNKAEKISVESRPEYITNYKLLQIKNILNSKEFEIGIGLETANDFIRKYSINKGFNFNQYKKSIKIIKNNKFKIKTYLLLKPPFLTEEEAINDIIQTVKKIKNMTDLISLNPTNIQRNTYIEYLWKRKQYTPPWLWSVIKVLIQSKKIIGEKRIKSDVVGGGSIRGPHNCGKCDYNILENISNFSINQNIELLKNIDCDCYEKWLDQIDIEKYCFGSQINTFRKLT